MELAARPERMFDHMQHMIAGEAPAPPIADLVGLRVIAVRPAEADVELQAGAHHANPMGTLHGGILCDLADLAMGAAYASTLAAGETFTTLELKINFLRPVWKDTLEAKAKVTSRGRTVGLVECEISDSKGRLVAKSTSTCMTLQKDKHANR